MSTAVLDRQIDRGKPRGAGLYPSPCRIEEAMADAPCVREGVEVAQRVGEGFADMAPLQSLEVEGGHDALTAVVTLQTQGQVGELGWQVGQVASRRDVALGLGFTEGALPF